jgi:foldase protein PrsA
VTTIKITRIVMALGAFFVCTALFAGCGGVPGDAVASISGRGTIKKSDFDHWLYIAAASGQMSSQPGAKVVVPDPPSYTKCIAGERATQPAPAKGVPPISDAQLKKQCVTQYQSLTQQVMSFLISAAWIEGEAADQGVDQNAKKLDQTVYQMYNMTKQQSFPNPANFQKFLAQSGETVSDLLLRVKLNVLSNDIRTKVTAGKGNVTPAQIQQYYNLNKARFGTPQRRNLLDVQTTTLPKANAALALLQKHTPFAAVVKRYSTDKTSKAQGGKLTGVVQGQQVAAFDSAIFSAPLNTLEGPIKTEFGYYVFEVTKITPGTQKSLAQESATIKQLVSSQNQQNALQTFVTSFQKKWTKRTTCGSGFEGMDCHNYKAPKTPATTAAPGAAAPPSGAAAPPSGAAGSSGAPPSTVTVPPSSGATTTP